MASLKEFKFHKSSDAHRRAFLAGLQPFDFVVRALAVNKTRLPLSFRKMDKLSFYAFFLNDLIQHIPVSELGQTSLVLDQFDGVGRTVRMLKRQLKASGKMRSIKRITARRSQGEDALQVADMVAGAILRSMRTGDHSWYGPIQGKVMLWEYVGHENPPS